LAEAGEGRNGPMIAGHFGFAAAVKSKARGVPLWGLMLGAVWLDVVFVPLLLAGVERLEPLAGTHGGYGQAVIYADYTHSLLGAVALSVLFGGFFALLWGRGPGAVMAGMSFSHWVLDLPMHRADMPLLPGNAGDLPRLGFGLWRWPVASAGLELALVALGSGLYWRAAREVAGESGARRASWLGSAAFAFGVLVLGLNLAGQ
jgi:hypothetical protein